MNASMLFLRRLLLGVTVLLQLSHEVPAAPKLPGSSQDHVEPARPIGAQKVQKNALNQTAAVSPTVRMTYPVSGEKNVPLNATLRWEATPSAGLHFDVYLVCRSDIPEGSAPQPVKVAENLSTPGFQPTGLRNGEQYWWRVVARNGTNQTATAESIWFFTPNQAPSAPGLVLPADQATVVRTPGKELAVLLQWNASVDPENNRIHYFIHVGASPDRLSALYNTAATQVHVKALDPYAHTLYWKVEARDVLGAQSFSEIRAVCIPGP